MQIQVDRDESQLLHRLLQGAMEELRVEVHHSRGWEFKAELKHREAMILRLIQRIDEAAGKAGE